MSLTEKRVTVVTKGGTELQGLLSRREPKGMSDYRPSDGPQAPSSRLVIAGPPVYLVLFWAEALLRAEDLVLDVDGARYEVVPPMQVGCMAVTLMVRRAQ